MRSHDDTTQRRDHMKLREISFSNFRNYQSFMLDNIGNLTILVGDNGVGKTNILEGIQLMTSGDSFRHAQIAQLIHEGAPFARIRTETSDGNRLMLTELTIEPGKKRYCVNGKAKSIVDIRGVLPAVVFTPDDLDLAKKSSSVKRDALDVLGMQLTRNYYIVRRDYEKVVRYKNRLLKEEASQALVESIDETLVTCGSQLFCYRLALFNRLVPLVKENYAHIVVGSLGRGEGEEFGATYRASWTHLSGDGNLELAEFGAPDRNEVKEWLYKSLEKFREDERMRRRSLVGPHNDKIEFFLNGRDASNFASQGQQRSIVLAWKLAEVSLIRASLGTSPVLLLDDVMSELDGNRRDMLVRFVTNDIQTFITATDLSGFNTELLDRSSVVELR